MPPSFGAGALLHPGRKLTLTEPSRAHETVDFDGAGVRLRGWWFRGEGTRRGTIVYLHGVADNRGSSAWIADHFVPLGFDLIAYDSRAHGQSSGDACTYGYYEKQDLGRVLGRVDVTPIIVIGSSLGAAVALQAAAEDARISAVVAVATFSDLRAAAMERAPFFASKGNIEDAFRIAEQSAHFQVDEVSPVGAAARINAPVLLIHGDGDRETPPIHSRRVFDALHDPKRFILIPRAGHNNALSAAIWHDLDAWLESALKRKAG
jgi:pimeloyl-ACP methyl ester carboxylesterase